MAYPCTERVSSWNFWHIISLRIFVLEFLAHYFIAFHCEFLSLFSDYTVWYLLHSQHLFSIQVNFCQQLLFLHQLTHNITKDFSLNYQFNTWKFQAQNMLCAQIGFCFCFDLQNNFMYTTCSWHVLSLEFSWTELVIPWTIVCYIVG